MPTLFRARHATFLLLFACGLCAARDFETCQYNTDDDGDEKTETRCLALKGPAPQDHLVADATVAAGVVRKLLFDEDGLAAIRWREGFMYVNRQGLARISIMFDNGLDPFEEGLARTRQNGKIGFFDKTLKIVIPAVHDFAFPFSEGSAVVCNGCKPRKDVTGEHTSIDGGMWGVIDHKGHYSKSPDLPVTQ